MNNFREVNDDILREWLSYREETELGYLTQEDKKHNINFDEIVENVLKNVRKQNQKFAHAVQTCSGKVYKRQSAQRGNKTFLRCAHARQTADVYHGNRQRNEERGLRRNGKTGRRGMRYRFHFKRGFRRRGEVCALPPLLRRRGESQRQKRKAATFAER